MSALLRRILPPLAPHLITFEDLPMSKVRSSGPQTVGASRNSRGIHKSPRVCKSPPVTKTFSIYKSVFRPQMGLRQRPLTRRLPKRFPSIKIGATPNVGEGWQGGTGRSEECGSCWGQFGLCLIVKTETHSDIHVQFGVCVQCFMP
jgi:hypothetical protein